MSTTTNSTTTTRSGRWRPLVRVAGLGLACAGVFGAALAAGDAAAPVGLTNAEPADDEHGAGEATAMLPGLATTADGYRLVTTERLLPADRRTTVSFMVTGPDGPVSEFDVEHTKRMHLVAVRRDGTGFQHEHPTMAPDGTWTASVRFAEPGVHRLYADFVIDGEKRTLGTDVFVPGPFEPAPEPAPADAVTLDGYRVERLPAPVIAGEETELAFTVRRGGAVVEDVEDYLGAKGHLVILRDGDLAYLHVHAETDRLAFRADLPSAGTYRLYLQFRHDGRLLTVPFTVHAEEARS